MAFSDKYFSANSSLENLGAKTAIRGAKAVSGQASVFLVQLIGIITLARMLPPSDFGLVGMVTVIMQFIFFFRDFGLTKATIQRAHITREEISNLFWINAIISLSMSACLFLSSSFIANFYGRLELNKIVWVLSVGIVIEGLTLQHRALMVRCMEFGKLAICDVIAQLASLIVALIFAYRGAGYWALVLMPITNSVCRLIFILSATRWVPSMANRSIEIRRYVEFGGNLFGYNLLNYFLRNTDNILVGRYLGADALGMYSYAYRLLMLPIQQLNGPLLNVMLPTFSQLQEQPDRFSVVYYKTLSMVVSITFPFIGLAYAVAPMAFTVILGDKWVESAYLFQILTPAAFVTSLNVATDWVYLARGDTKRMFYWALIRVPLTLVCMLFGLHYGGAEGVAFAVSFSLCVLLVPYMKATFGNTNLLLSRVCATIGRAIFPVLVANLTIAALGFYLVVEHGLFQLLMYSMLYGTVYFTVDLATNRSSSSFNHIFIIIKKLRK